jgi:hypothetical protein
LKILAPNDGAAGEDLQENLVQSRPAQVTFFLLLRARNEEDMMARARVALVGILALVDGARSAG